MSDRTPAGEGGRGRRARERPDWLEHSGASVFDQPSPGNPPPQDWPPPPAPPGRDPRGGGAERSYDDPWRDPPGAPSPDPWGAGREDRPGDPWRERRRRPAPWATPPGGHAAAQPPADPWAPPPPPGARPPAGTWDDSRTATRVWPETEAPGDPRAGGGAPPRRRPDQQRATPAGTRQQRPGPQGGRRNAPPGGGRDRDSSGRGDGGGGGFRSPIGLGAVVGGLGLLAFLAALIVLPWFTAGGDDVTLADIRSAFSVPATDPSDLPGAGDPTATTLPEGIPTPDDVADAVEQQARDTATTAAASAIDDGKARYLELYTDTLWVGIAITVGIAAVVSTILAPKSMALSLLLGVRRIAGAAVVMAALAHAAALWVVFTGDGAPSPAFGVWLGVAGLAGVLAGCIIGPRSS